MYYKIQNKECEVYKKPHELRTRELQIDKENEAAINERTGLEFEGFLGRQGQQNARRVTQYTGFKFTEPEKVDPKTWKEHPDHKGIFVPNKRTKAGREMKEFLLNGLESSSFLEVFEILDLDIEFKIGFPYVEIIEDGTIILWLHDEQEPKDPNLIEITKREFNELENMELEKTEGK